MAETKLKDHYKIETWKKWAFRIFFVLIAGLLVYISFFAGSSGGSDSGGADTTGNFFSSITGGFSLTGGAIKVSELESPITINAKLSVPSKFSLDERFSRLEILFSSPTSFNLGDQSFNFSEGDKLILENYRGELSTTNETAHYRIEGEASKADLKGITMSAQGETFDVFSSSVATNSINATNVSLGNFEQNTSGKINVGNNIFNPQKELTIIESFTGDISLSSKGINLKGKAESLQIKGESDISVSN
ncbi:MAG: hypothetical protein ABEI74_03290 [Candidatus Pacearchaeota archaeon]